MSSTLCAQSMPAGINIGAQQIRNFRAILDDRVREADTWDREADLEIALTIVVISFGALIAGMQGATQKSARAATVIMGAAITIITGVNAKVFPADFKTLSQSSFQLRKTILNLQTMLNEQDPDQLSGSNLQVFDASFLLALSQLDQIHEKLYGAQSLLLRMESVTYAQSLSRPYGPTWITNPPKDDRHIYFVGKASFPELTSARIASLENARSEAAKSIGKTNVPLLSLVSLVAESGSVQDSYIGFDQKSGEYTFYTLLRLSSEIINIISPSMVGSVPFVSDTSRTLFLNGITVTHDGSPRSTSWRFEVYVNGEKVADVPTHKFASKEKSLLVSVNGPITWVPVKLPLGRNEIKVKAFRQGSVVADSGNLDFTLTRPSTISDGLPVWVRDALPLLGEFRFNFYIPN